MDRIAVLGLGRMGGAMAGRLAALGWEVTGWSRSGRTVDGVTPADSPAEAAAKADVVVLALYDGPACREVLAGLPPGGIVVNTSTVGVAEAEALAARVGSGYVHAPVLGSVPAAAGGQLTVLAGMDAGGSDAHARPVLEALGEVIPVGDVRTAAALKLVVAASLAGTVGALRETLVQADALGLPRAQVLDVLTRGQLGAFVERKRAFLDGDPPAAQFTVGALAKDVALLAAATDRPLRLVAELEEQAPDADIASAATAAGVDDEVLAPLRSYIRGHATGDPAHFDAAFLPSARIAGLRDGAFVSWTLDDYRALFSGHPAPDEATRTRRIDAVDVHGTVATATMTLHHGPDTFTDVFLLVRLDARWWIADKAYHRRTGVTTAATTT